MYNSAENKIKKAYYACLRTKPYNKITVSEIIKAAGVNRSTFYRYYTDIFSLYKAVSGDLITSVLFNMPAAVNGADMRACAEETIKKALIFKDELTLLAGKNGNIKFLYELRNAYFEALKTNAVKNGLWNKENSYFTCFAADYLVFTLAYLINDEKYKLMDFSDIDFLYDYNADPVYNLSEALRILNGGSRDVNSAFILSLIRRFSVGDSRARPISEIFSYSGFSRTEFYKLFSHKADCFQKIEKALLLIIVKGVIPFLEIDTPDKLSLVLNNWDKYYKEIERNAVIIGLNDGYLLEIGLKTIIYLYTEYKTAFEKRIKVKLTAEMENELAFFVCSAVCGFAYYIATMDKAEYFRRMNSLFDVKNRQLKILNGE